MNCEFIESGRFEQPTIWVNDFKPLGQFTYPRSTTGNTMIALTKTQAIELHQELGKAISKAEPLPSK